MEVLRDKLGQIVRPGDLVIGAALRCRSAEIRIGVVEKVKGTNISVMRVAESYNWQAKSQVYGFRRHTTSPNSVVVIRWNSITEDSKYHEILLKLKEKVMKQ